MEDTVLSQTYTYNDIHIAPAKPDGTAWTWEGHIFSGWGRADTVEWLPGQIIPELTTTDGETVNVYAIWLDYYNVALGYDSNTIKSATKTAGHYSDGNPNHYNYHEQITFTATLKDDETYPNDYQHPGYKYTFKRWMFSHTDLGKGTISGRTSTLVLTTGEDPLTIGGEVRVYGNKYDKHYYFVYSDYGTAKITSGGTTKENEMILVSKYTGTAYDTYAGDEFSVSVDIDSNFYVDHWERRTESGSYEIIPNSSTTTLSGLHADEYTRYRAIVKVDGQAVYILAPDDLDNFQVISQPVRIVNGMPEANNTIFIGKEYPDDYATANPNGKIAKAKIGDFFLMAKEEE